MFTVTVLELHDPVVSSIQPGGQDCKLISKTVILQMLGIMNSRVP